MSKRESTVWEPPSALACCLRRAVPRGDSARWRPAPRFAAQRAAFIVACCLAASMQARGWGAPGWRIGHWLADVAASGSQPARQGSMGARRGRQGCNGKDGVSAFLAGGSRRTAADAVADSGCRRVGAICMHGIGANRRRRARAGHVQARLRRVRACGAPPARSFEGRAAGVGKSARPPRSGARGGHGGAAVSGPGDSGFRVRCSRAREGRAWQEQAARASALSRARNRWRDAGAAHRCLPPQVQRARPGTPCPGLRASARQLPQQAAPTTGSPSRPARGLLTTRPPATTTTTGSCRHSTLS